MPVYQDPNTLQLAGGDLETASKNRPAAMGVSRNEHDQLWRLVQGGATPTAAVTAFFASRVGHEAPTATAKVAAIATLTRWQAAGSQPRCGEI